MSSSFGGSAATNEGDENKDSSIDGSSSKYLEKKCDIVSPGKWNLLSAIIVFSVANNL